MAEERKKPSLTDDEILQQQYRRALSSFEGIILSQIDIKNRLGSRLNYSIQAGITILGAIAVSILVLLLTLTTQITKISNIVAEMNTHFTSVSTQMNQISGHMKAMEERVSLMGAISVHATNMDSEMALIKSQMDAVRETVAGINTNVYSVRNSLGNISVNMDLLNNEIQVMGGQMLYMSKPARTFNNMFPFP
ncbi:MAG: translation initiation factor 2 [Gammaproteobacteria bacterium]|jgi:prefoldin subunit 5|nr:translation initiation factor 2 [Gammaproteobacteria bacterium]